MWLKNVFSNLLKSKCFQNNKNSRNKICDVWGT
jgi:hypothetical protein